MNKNIFTPVVVTLQRWNGPITTVLTVTCYTSTKEVWTTLLFTHLGFLGRIWQALKVVQIHLERERIETGLTFILLRQWSWSETSALVRTCIVWLIYQWKDRKHLSGFFISLAIYGAEEAEAVVGLENRLQSNVKNGFKFIIISECVKNC